MKSDQGMSPKKEALPRSSRSSCGSWKITFVITSCPASLLQAVRDKSWSEHDGGLRQSRFVIGFFLFEINLYLVSIPFGSIISSRFKVAHGPYA